MKFIMGSPIQIMGKVRGSNLSDTNCLAIQNAHLILSSFQFLVVIKLISDILLISERTETRSGSAEGCGVLVEHQHMDPPSCLVAPCQVSWA